MKPARILTLLFLFAAFTAAAQGGRDAIEEQKRVIAALEKRIADEERAISKIQEGRAATEERVRRLARQLDSRNQLLEETEKQVRLLRKEISQYGQRRRRSQLGPWNATVRSMPRWYARPTATISTTIT